MSKGLRSRGVEAEGLESRDLDILSFRGDGGAGGGCDDRRCSCNASSPVWSTEGLWRSLVYLRYEKGVKGV